MTLMMKIYAGAAAALLLAALISWYWAEYKLKAAEMAANDAKAAGMEQAALARRSEMAAADYRKKIEYLEESLSDVRQIAEKQDAELEILKGTADDARGSVRRARSIERVETTAADLCRKLADLGHPCN